MFNTKISIELCQYKSWKRTYAGEQWRKDYLNPQRHRGEVYRVRIKRETHRSGKLKV